MLVSDGIIQQLMVESDHNCLRAIVIFFAQSVLIKLALPKAAQLSLFLKSCTSMRDLIKDAPLIDRKRKKPGAPWNQTWTVRT